MIGFHQKIAQERTCISLINPLHQGHREIVGNLIPEIQANLEVISTPKKLNLDFLEKIIA